MGTAEPRREKENFLPGKDAANEKSWILDLLQSSRLPFPSIEVSSFPCVGTCL